MGGPLRVGIVGVGYISGEYLAQLPRLPGLRLAGVADLDEDRARAVAAAQGVPSRTVDELLADPGIDAILNLTIPAAHAEITERALVAGKHVYSEKPLALEPAMGRRLLDVADAHGVRIGTAPDTVLGTGIQTARALLDEGRVGVALGAAASWVAPGHELWHPAPQFYYDAGGGPVLDMGPYYLSALVTLLGPVARVSAAVGRSGRRRTIATGPAARRAIVIDPSIDTHVTAILEHASGAASSLLLSFEVWASRAPRIELFGTTGTIAVPDPNQFSEPVEVQTATDRRWESVEPLAGYSDGGRGIGLGDMARAIETDRPHRASGVLALHILEVMTAIGEAGRGHAPVAIASRPDRPAPVPFRAKPDTW